MRASTSAPCATSWRGSTGAASCGGPEVMVERAVILAVASALVVMAVVVVRTWSGRRVDALRANGSRPLWTALGESPDGRPSLVVFSTPSCTACRTVQLPAVEAVQASFGSALRVLKVDLSKQPSA